MQRRTRVAAALLIIFAAGISLAACGGSPSSAPAVSTTQHPAAPHLTWSAAKIISEVKAVCGPNALNSSADVTNVVIKGTPSDNGSTESANMTVTAFGGYETINTTFTLDDKAGSFSVPGVCHG